jgi:hypothetical protein
MCKYVYICVIGVYIYASYMYMFHIYIKIYIYKYAGWYPLGRTIGGTIYPGLMLTAALFYWLLNAINVTINIRNMCVFIAPIFRYVYMYF